MSPGVLIGLSGALTFGAPLLFAVGELIALRRQGRNDDGHDRPEEPTPPPPPDRSGPHVSPLPACLIPQLYPAPRTERRVRELA